MRRPLQKYCAMNLAGEWTSRAFWTVSPKSSGQYGAHGLTKLPVRFASVAVMMLLPLWPSATYTAGRGPLQEPAQFSWHASTGQTSLEHCGKWHCPSPPVYSASASWTARDSSFTIRICTASLQDMSQQHMDAQPAPVSWPGLQVASHQSSLTV